MKATFLFASLLALAPIAPAQAFTLTTQTTGGTTLGSWAGANSWFFDINVTNPGGISITQIDTRILTGTGTMDVYVTAAGGSFVPVISTPAAWTNVGTAPMSATATGMATGLLTAPILLAPGTYGMCLHLINLQGTYSSPGTPPTIPLVYNDANLTIDCNVSRMRNCTTVDPFTGGTSPNPRVPNLIVSYTTSPQSVNFTSDVTRGVSPLTVQFSDRSYSTLPGGIIAWAWDFDNDGIVDSNQPNPLHTYTACGNYTVSLTIADNSGAFTETKIDYIQTDLFTATGFSWQYAGANTIQFTDTTAPTPSIWAWDLDGDNVIDSTLPNPQFVYPLGTAEVTVTQTVTLACRAAVTTTRRILVSQGLETTDLAGLIISTTATGGTNLFDLTVNTPTGVVINAMHVRSNVALGSNLGVDVWINPTTYVGNQAIPDVWRRVASTTVLSAGPGARSLVTFPEGIYLPAGTYGVAVQQIGNSPIYTNMNGVQTFSNADMTITAGATMADPLFSTGTYFSPRIWNGAIYYSTAPVAYNAGYTFFNLGCASSLGVSGNTSTTAPHLGTVMSIQVDNMPYGVAFLLLGFSKTNSAFGPLPLDLGLVGAPGCFLRVSNDARFLLIAPGGTASALNLPIPNNTSLLGMRFFTQPLVLDATVNALGLVTGDAAAGVLGN